jgi:hypothetical protein
MAEPAQAPQPVIDGDHHNVGGDRQRTAVVQARAGMPDREAAAVQPHHHGAVAVQRGGVDVQVQTLLVGRR